MTKKVHKNTNKTIIGRLKLRGKKSSQKEKPYFLKVDFNDFSKTKITFFWNQKILLKKKGIDSNSQKAKKQN